MERAINTLPRVNKLWFLYVQTEEMLKNYPMVRAVFEDYEECLQGLKEKEKVRLMVQQLKDNETSKNGITASELYKASNTLYENLDLIKRE